MGPSGRNPEDERRNSEGDSRPHRWRLLPCLPSRGHAAGCNILGSRLEPAVKDGHSAEERSKARLVISGHVDKDKARVVHASPTCTRTRLVLVLAFASVIGFNVWTQDIAQAYLESSTKFLRQKEPINGLA